MGLAGATLVLLPLAALALARPAAADADGPDHYRVRDLHPGAVLVMLDGPGLKHKIIAHVPHAATKLKNLGCKGGMNVVQWEKATPAQRKVARYTRWCKVTFTDKAGKAHTGWVNGGYLGE